MLSSDLTHRPKSVFVAGVALVAALWQMPAARAQQTAQASSDDAVMLPDTVVTATRDATPAERVANSITVVDRKTIEERQYGTVADVLNDVPGLAINQSGDFGKSTSIFVRGTNSNHVLVLIDGLRANDPSTSGGTFNFAHLLADMVERIEIVRGPLSTLYGSDAIGGVINIITRKGSGAPSFTARAEGGSFGTVGGSVTGQGAVGRFNYNVGVSGLSSDGVSVTPQRLRAPGMRAENDGYRNLTFASRLGASLTDNFDVSLFTRYISTYSEYDQSAAEDPNLRENTAQFYGRAVGELWLMDGKWKQTFGLGYVDIARQDLDRPDEFNPFPYSRRTANKGKRLTADWQNDIDVSDIYKLTVGVDGEREWLDNNTDGFRTSSDVSTFGAFVQNRFTLFERLFLTAAARLDHNSAFGTSPTFSFGAAYLIPDTDTKLKASIGTAYKAPSLFQLYGKVPPFFTGNAGLKPEKSTGFDLGFEQNLGGKQLSFGSTFFWNDIRDLIDSDATYTTVINVGHVRTYGLESFIAVRPLEWIQLRVDHTWTHTEDMATGRPLARRPAHKVTGTVDVTATEDLTLGFAVTWNGARPDIDPVTFGRTTNAGYTLATLTADYRVRKGVDIYGKVQNVFDQKYEDPLGYAHPGLAFYGGVRARF